VDGGARNATLRSGVAAAMARMKAKCHITSPMPCFACMTAVVVKGRATCGAQRNDYMSAARCNNAMNADSDGIVSALRGWLATATWGAGGAWRVSKVLCAGIFPDSPARWEVMLWIKTHRSGEPRQALCAPGRRTRHLQTAAQTRDR